MTPGRPRAEMPALGCCARSLRLCDDALNAIDDGPYRRERLNFLISIIGDFDPESILNIEHDHREIKGFDLKIAQGRFERHGLRWVLHILTQNLDDLGR